MSSLARHFLSEKKVVRGSDQALTDLTKTLTAEGIQVCCPQSVENIAPDTELVIYNNLSFSDVCNCPADMSNHSVSII
jgi:UDP-N-acetylmuramate-alanine ligase